MSLSLLAISSDVLTSDAFVVVSICATTLTKGCALYLRMDSQEKNRGYSVVNKQGYLSSEYE